MFKKISLISNKNKIRNGSQLNNQVDSISRDSNNLVIKTNENSKTKFHENPIEESKFFDEYSIITLRSELLNISNTDSKLKVENNIQIDDVQIKNKISNCSNENKDNEIEDTQSSFEIINFQN